MALTAVQRCKWRARTQAAPGFSRMRPDRACKRSEARSNTRRMQVERHEAPRQRHPRAHAVHRAFELLAAIRVIDRAARTALIDNQVTWETVRGWCSGRRRIPLWAINALRARLRPYVEIAAQLDELARARELEGVPWKPGDPPKPAG